jgi:regulatory protein
VAFRKRASNKVYDENSLHEYALGALSRRMRTVAELKRLMRMRVGRQADGDELMDRVVSRLKDQKLLNDTNFATIYSTYRKDNEKFGSRRVVQDLKQKGVHGDVITKAIAATYDGVDEQELARKFIARKRLKKPADQKQTARVFRMMVRAGFSTRAIVSILKHWEVDDETVMALEQERAEMDDAARDEEGTRDKNRESEEDQD